MTSEHIDLYFQNKLEVRVNQDDVDALNQQFVAALHAYDEVSLNEPSSV